MVVDDDESTRQAIGRMLDAAGFRAELFVSGASLLESDAAYLPQPFSGPALVEAVVQAIGGRGSA